MKKINPFLAIVFIAAAVAIIGYAYVVFGNRYGKKSKDNANSNTNKSSIIDNLGNYLGSSEDDNMINVDLSENANANVNENRNQNANVNSNDNNNTTDLKEVTSKDCGNDCVKFKDNAASYKYCQQVCGDTPASQKSSEEECASLAGLEKDYCLKDLAISKKDFVICNKIQDAKIKKVCKNRITEDLIN